MEKDREWPNRQEPERIRRVMPRRIRDGETRAGNKRRKCRQARSAIRRYAGERQRDKQHHRGNERKECKQQGGKYESREEVVNG